MGEKPQALGSVTVGSHVTPAASDLRRSQQPMDEQKCFFAARFARRALLNARIAQLVAAAAPSARARLGPTDAMSYAMRLLRSPRGLSPTGSAASLVGPVLPLVAGAIYAGHRWPELVLIPQRPSQIVQALGWLWLAFGVGFWMATLLRFLPRWTRGELITSGPYALCRHPLYALVPFFILPALGLITENRAYFLVALISVPLALRAGLREEPELLRLYGDGWTAYANRTSALLPLPAAGHITRVLARVAWASAALFVLYLSVLQPFHVS